MEYFARCCLTLTTCNLDDMSCFFLQNNVIVGDLPIMLRSCRCVLYGKDEEELARLGLLTLKLNYMAFLLSVLFLGLAIVPYAFLVSCCITAVTVLNVDFR